MGEDKLFMDLAGKPVLARTLTALNACSCVDEIVVVTRLESLEKVAALCREYRVDKVGRSLSAVLRAPNPRWPVSYRSGAMQNMYSSTMALVRL